MPSAAANRSENPADDAPVQARSALGVPRLSRRLTVARARRSALALVAGCAWLCVIAPVASATDGHGIYGDTTDKVVTLAGFCIMGFFVFFIFTMSMIQGRLEKRKQARKAAQSTLSAGRWRGGW